MQFEAFRPILFPEVQASSVFMSHHGEVKDSECLAVLYFSLVNRGGNAKGSAGH